MIRRLLLAAAPLLALPLTLAACNSNTAPGNDREAQSDAAPSPAPVVAAGEALSGVAVETLQVETMTGADLATLGGPTGKCLIRLTRIGLPSFVYDAAGGTGFIKLNGRLIPLPPERIGLFASGDLRVAIRPVDAEFGSDGVREAEMIVMLPHAKDELGYRGYEDCSNRAA